jgi:hypothetical protein
MEWLYVFGVIIAAVVFLVIRAQGQPDRPADGDRDDLRDSRWGDELHEYSYRHPWEDE